MDVVTGYRTTVTPIRDNVPTLSHDTSRTIKRQINGLQFGVRDTAMLNVLSARLELFMLLEGTTYPLGRYRFQDQTRGRFASAAGGSRLLSNTNLFDEMVIVDQPLPVGYSGFGNSSGPITPCQQAITDLLVGLPISYTVESSPYFTVGSWPIGTNRGYAMEQLAIDGDWLSPWFDNTGVMRFIRSFDPAAVVPDFNFDMPGKVLQGSPLESDDLLSAANYYIVVGNGASSAGAVASPVVGTYTVPASAPYSAANRGFVITKVENRQINDIAQAVAIAQNLGQRGSVFQRVQLSTIPDPRHDSYNTFIWQGDNYLETSWSLPLTENSIMTHVGRRVYS